MCTLVYLCLRTFHLNANLESNGSNRADILVTIKITFKTGLVCFRSGKFLWGGAGTLSRRSSRWWSWSRSWPSGRSSEGSASKTSGPEKRAILVLGVLFFTPLEFASSAIFYRPHSGDRTQTLSIQRQALDPYSKIAAQSRAVLNKVAHSGGMLCLCNTTTYWCE